MARRRRLIEQRDLGYLSTVPDRAIVADADFAALIGVSLATLWRLRERGELPPRVQLSERRYGTAWGEIKAWIKSREV